MSEHPTDRMIRTIDGAAADLRERLEALLQSEPTRSWMHAALLTCELLGLKNRDYGSSFCAGTRAETVYGLLVRISDKVARARKLAKAAMLEDMLPAGTAFEDLPKEWVCPICYATQDLFDPLD